MFLYLTLGSGVFSGADKDFGVRESGIAVLTVLGSGICSRCMVVLNSPYRYHFSLFEDSGVLVRFCG